MIKELQKTLKYNFRDVNLLRKSLVHKSYDSKENNEKLEFLGDRVLGLILSKILIETYPNEKEGIIDKKLANLVNKKTCTAIAKEINIQKYMFFGLSHKSLLNTSDKSLGDCIEALIGAIYLDGGLKCAEKFVLTLWNNYLKKSNFTTIDAKTRLQEYSLKEFKILPKYTFYKKSGPQHKPTFKTDVQIPNSKKIIGTGNSKKNAQQDAANKLLKILDVV